MIGTIVNASAIIIGGSIGLIAGSKLPEKITKLVFQAIGIFTLFMGIKLALLTENILFVVISIVVGSAIGQAIDIDSFIQKIGKKRHGASSNMGFIRNMFYKRKQAKEQTANTGFSDAVITTFILFCMGAMAILGALEDGMGETPNLLYAKSVLDGFASIALAAKLGIGVLVSIVPLIIFQGGISLFASRIIHVFHESVIQELSATGGLILIALALSMLEIKKITVINMLPALLIIVLMVHFLT